MKHALPDTSNRGFSRHAFLKFCALMASLLALPPGAAALLADSLSRARRLPVVWLSFQEERTNNQHAGMIRLFFRAAPPSKIPSGYPAC